MKTFWIMLVLATGGLGAAEARVFTVPLAQSLESPFASADNPFFHSYDFGIDGDSIVIITGTGDGSTAAALLYRRGSNGKWAFSRELYREALDAAQPTPTVVMKNSLAVIKIAAEATIWERSGSGWRRAATTEPILLPGKFAISQDRIIAGATECDGAYAYIYRRNAGVFAKEGMLRSYQGRCRNVAQEVELNYDTAIVRDGREFNYYHRGSGFEWDMGFYIYYPFYYPDIPGPAAVQNDRAILPSNLVFALDGDYWNETKPIKPIDWAAGTGEGSAAVYRDGLVLIADSWDQNRSTGPVYIYKRNAGGTFDHVGITNAWATTTNFDISGNTVITEEYRDFLGYVETGITIYTLPADIVKPRAIVNNFDARDVSDFTTSPGSQFALAGNSYNYIYRQSNLAGDTSAVLATSNWPDYQRVTADVRPTAFARSDGWAGLGARYVDENNYYFVTLGNDDILRLQRKLDGVVTTLAQKPASIPTGATIPVVLTVSGSNIGAVAGSGASTVSLSAMDSSIKSGRAALLTSGARADFDNLHVAPSSALRLFSIDPPEQVFGRPFTYVGGQWDYDDWIQEDTSGQALAVNGLVNVSDQSVTADLTINNFATTDPVAWVGTLARYRDPKNFYYASLRSSNQLQIRKVVNGVTTVLKAVNLAVTPGEPYRLNLSVLGNELSASVNGAVVARAIDNDIPTGKFGVGTYRAAAEFTSIFVSQP